MESNKEKIREKNITNFTTLLINSVGYDKAGKDKNKVLINGFYENGIHSKTGTKYNVMGIDIDGYDIFGAFHFDRGYFVDKNGAYNPIYGHNSKGFNSERKHYLTGTEYNPEGYNVEGFDKNGINQKTGTIWSPGGFDMYGYSKKLGRYLTTYHKFRNKSRNIEYDPFFKLEDNMEIEYEKLKKNNML